jgi:hypothetical protein
MCARSLGKQPRTQRRLLRALQASYLNTRYNPPALVGIIEGVVIHRAWLKKMKAKKQI